MAPTPLECSESTSHNQPMSRCHRPQAAVVCKAKCFRMKHFFMKKPWFYVIFHKKQKFFANTLDLKSGYGMVFSIVSVKEMIWNEYHG